MIRFTENLDQLLFENHMTRAELAAKIGVGKSTITAWYNKSCDGVRLDTLLAISELFNVSLDELVRGKVEAKPEQFTADEVAQLKRLINQV